MPTERVTPINEAPVRGDGDYVLYWMIATRRTRASFGLQHALEQARELGRPLLVFEPLRLGYRWASVRHHRFAIEGMVDNQAAFEAAGVTYLPYVEPEEGDGKGLLRALASRACLVVTDTYPTFFLPRMVAAAGASLDVRLQAVDSLGLVPLAWHERTFTVAHSFRRQLHKWLMEDGLPELPEPEPLTGYELGRAALPAGVPSSRAADLPALLAGGLGSLAVDHEVGAVPTRGGAVAAHARLDGFLDTRLARYADARNDPEDEAASELSSHLHWGHLGVHEILPRLLARDGWTEDRLDPRQLAKNTGFWGTSPEVESFLDELVTWRELGHGFCYRNPDDHDRFESLPDWALTSLEEHAADPRPYLYDLEALERGATHDELWNAAQGQLRAEGRIHNYLRMLWGKKILHWTRSPREALDVLIHLNNRWATDGRDPNSYSGIFWTLGRFDRAWGPERPVFGKVRYMTSDSTRRKLAVGSYIQRWTRELPRSRPASEAG